MRLRRHRLPRPSALGAVSAVALLAIATLSLTPQSAPAEQAAPLIVIDPGHGGPYSNANANGLREKTVNLQVSLALRDALAARGYRVFMTRTTDRAVELRDIPTWNYRSTDGSWHYRRDGVTGMDDTIPEDDLQARVEVANRAGADLFISVHSNGARTRSTRGYETFASRRDALGRSLSYSVQRAVIEATGLIDRGAQVKDFYVCRWTDAPAILVETAFISNPYDATLLKSASFRGRLAEGIARGVESWFATAPYRRVMRRYSATDAASHAVALSRAAHPAGAPVAVVAAAASWHEVPGAVSLARALGGPLLWAAPGDVPTSTAAELARLRPASIVLVGSDASVASLPATGLAEAAALDASAVETLAAGDAAGLSALIARRTAMPAGGAVFICSASTPRAALVAAPVAASMGAPLLLTRDGTATPEVEEFLEQNRGQLRRVVLVGSAERLPDSAAAGIEHVRYTGSDMAGIAWALNGGRYRDRTPDSLIPLVSDERFGPEYLAAATRSAALGQPLLPARGQVISPKTREWITNRRSVIRTFEIHDARRATPVSLDHVLRKADYL